MLNKVILIGRLTRDPELKYTPNGNANTTFTIAVDRPRAKDKEQEADFISVVCWRQLAETVANYMKKGRLVGVVGRMEVRNYEKDGRKVYVTEVLADEVKFLDSGKGEEAPKPDPNKAPWDDDDLPQ